MDDRVTSLSERELAELAALADGTLPAERRAAVEARGAGSPGAPELLPAPRLALAGGLAVVAAVLAVVLTGGPGGPSVAEAAELADRPASAPPPPRAGEGGTQLALDVEGVAF